MPIDRIIESPIVSRIKRAKLDERKFEAIVDLLNEIKEALSSIAEEYRVSISF